MQVFLPYLDWGSVVNDAPDVGDALAVCASLDVARKVLLEVSLRMTFLTADQRLELSSLLLTATDERQYLTSEDDDDACGMWVWYSIKELPVLED